MDEGKQKVRKRERKNLDGKKKVEVQEEKEWMNGMKRERRGKRKEGQKKRMDERMKG